jgi:glycerol-3-phosphate acyltransferase PlsY
MDAWPGNAVLILVAYLLGSLPFALLVSRRVAGVDIRRVGSGHAGATNTMRAAGWPAGILVMALDVGKGYLAVWLAQRFGDGALVPALAAAGAVIGHCWPVLAGFRGGMGVATAGGALGAIWPLGLVLAVGLGAAGQLLLRQTARGNFLTGLLVAPLWWLFGAEPIDFALAAAVGLLVSIRALSDWNRVYRELWLDREVRE